MRLLKQKKYRISISLLFVALAIFVLPCIALADAKLVLNYPADVPASEVNLRVFANAPTSSTIQENSFNTTYVVRIEPEVDGSWLLKQPGVYCYYVAPNTAGKYYSVLKLINVTESDVTNNVTIEKTLLTGPMAGNGYEMCWNPDLVGLPAGKTNKTDGRDRSMGIYTDEVEALYGTDDQPVSTAGVCLPQRYVSGHYAGRDDGLSGGNSSDQPKGSPL